MPPYNIPPIRACVNPRPSVSFCGMTAEGRQLSKWCVQSRKTLDSRLRGNDVGEGGNDVDGGECGDDGRLQEHGAVCGNDVGVYCDAMNPGSPSHGILKMDDSTLRRYEPGRASSTTSIFSVSPSERITSTAIFCPGLVLSTR